LTRAIADEIRAHGDQHMHVDVGIAIGLKQDLHELRGRVASAFLEFALWNDGRLDMEAEAKRLRAEEGMTNADELVVVGWMSPEQEPICSA
jgi:hypothetical protein